MLIEFTALTKPRNVTTVNYIKHSIIVVALAKDYNLAYFYFISSHFISSRFFFAVFERNYWKSCLTM